jgi:nitrate/nitrite transport system substrate-binding protein
MTKFTRREFIITAGAAAAGSFLAHGCSTGSSNTSQSASSSNSSSGAAFANINPADAPEVTKAKLGFIALTDCSPLVIAKEKGLFAKYGMKDVEVVKQASWGTTRDNLDLGSQGGGIDGAHILSPMPYLMSEGRITMGNKKRPMYVLARLNTNGQAISVAKTHKDLNIRLDSSPLKQRIQEVEARGGVFKCAVTFPGGTHDLWLRYWLAAGGIDPDKEASTMTVPPPQMVANMRIENMETFCVGEPWNALLVNQKFGYTAVTTGELWKDHPEKAFSMRADWVDKHPKATMALLKAVLEAQIWCEKPENKEEMVNIVSKNKWIKTKPQNILARSKGTIDYGDGRKVENSPHRMKFWSDDASYPYKSHDLWFVTEDIRWGYLPADTDTKKLVDAVNREDLWRDAAKAIGQEAAIPKSTSRGVETFFDGIKFDPENPQAYLNSLKIKRV